MSFRARGAWESVLAAVRGNGTTRLPFVMIEVCGFDVLFVFVFFF